MKTLVEIVNDRVLHFERAVIFLFLRHLFFRLVRQLFAFVNVGGPSRDYVRSDKIDTLLRLFSKLFGSTLKLRFVSFCALFRSNFLKNLSLCNCEIFKPRRPIIRTKIRVAVQTAATTFVCHFLMHYFHSRTSTFTLATRATVVLRDGYDFFFGWVSFIYRLKARR